MCLWDICDGVGCNEFPFFKLLVWDYAQRNIMSYIGTALEELFVIYRLLCFDPLRRLLIFVSSVRYSDELVLIIILGVFFFF